MLTLENSITKNFTIDHVIGTLESFDAELSKLVNSDYKRHGIKVSRAQANLYNALNILRQFKNEIQAPLTPEKELLEFIIPEWAQYALINGDPFEAGTDEQNAEDERKLNTFTKDCIEKYGHANFTTGEKSEVKSFLPTNHIDNLGSDCVTLYLLNEKS